MIESHMPEACRAFIALVLPCTVTDYLEKVQQCLAAQRIRGRWVRLTNMHLTLKFLGSLAPENIHPVGDLLASIAENTAPLELTAQGLGGFPNRRRPRVLWVGIGGQSQALTAIQKSVADGLVPMGWPHEKRVFKGHLTLARARGRGFFGADITRAMAHCEPQEPLDFKARQLVLYRSTLRPEGAVYDKLGQWHLRGMMS